MVGFVVIQQWGQRRGGVVNMIGHQPLSRVQAKVPPLLHEPHLPTCGSFIPVRQQDIYRT